MKSMVKTSAMVLTLAIAGLLVLSAAPALAAPDYYGGSEMQFDPELIEAMNEAMQNYGEEDYVVPPEEMPLDPCMFIECEEPGDEGEEPGEEMVPEDDSDIPSDHPGDNPGDDNPGFDGGEEDTPDQPVTPDEPVQPETPSATETPKAPVSSKLPNTGSGLLLLAAAGALLIVAAVVGRRMVLKRTR